MEKDNQRLHIMETCRFNTLPIRFEKDVEGYQVTFLRMSDQSET